MNWKKKVLLLGMVSVLGVGILGCGKQNSAVDSKTESTEQAESTEENMQESISDDLQEENVEIVGNKQLFTGDIARVSVHDPSIFRDVDEAGNVMYYIYGTHITSAKSEDLVNWETFTNGYQKTNNTLYGDLSANLSVPFAWAGENDADCKGSFAVWAPDIFYNENYVNEDGSTGAYMVYFCTSSTYCRSAIGYAVSDTVTGPYTYKGTLVYSGFTKISAKDNRSNIDKIWTNTNIDELMAEGRIKGEYNDLWGTSSYNTDYAPNAIDPALFTDTEGRLWMSYGSWSGGIYLLELDPTTGDAIYPGEDGLTEDGRVIDKYFGTRIAGGHTLSGEGPYIVYDESTEYYYLFTTYNYLDSVSGYNMRLFRSKKPEGPYLDAQGNNAVFDSRNANQYQIGIKVMGNYIFSDTEKGYRSPGHCSAFMDEDGQRYLIYHTRFDSAGEMFEVRVHQQFMNEDKWPVTAVFENRNDVIAEEGYTMEEIVGAYEFINHGTSSDGASVKEASIVILDETGSVSGDFSGTWSETEGTYYATFEIDGVTYKGVFFKQHTELADSEPTMTFTAIGSNNETIWGVKVSDEKEYVKREVEEKGAPATDFTAIDKIPVVKYTFEQADELELVGKAKIEDGVLCLADNSSSYGTTYACLPDLTQYDFSKGITLTADVLVSKYASDWTPIFMLGDAEVASGGNTLAYHFTQGFSSVTDDENSNKVGYYGVDIDSPYTWDYFNQRRAQNTWYTIAVTITESEMATYINGEQVQWAIDDYSMIMDTFKVATHNYLGGSYYSDPDFAGKLDNVAIYNTCLSEKEMKALAGK